MGDSPLRIRLLAVRSPLVRDHSAKALSQQDIPDVLDEWTFTTFSDRFYTCFSTFELKNLPRYYERVDRSSGPLYNRAWSPGALWKLYHI